MDLGIETLAWLILGLKSAFFLLTGTGGPPKYCVVGKKVATVGVEMEQKTVPLLMYRPLGDFRLLSVEYKSCKGRSRAKEKNKIHQKDVLFLPSLKLPSQVQTPEKQQEV